MKQRTSFYFLLLVLLLFALFIHYNTAGVYSFIGSYFYKINNIEKAQEFYEKSFSLGNDNAQEREIYVNSLINSPLNTSSQEKLVKIAEDNIKDNASEKAEYFLYDLKREIHRKYPSNYIKQAPYNHKIMRWSRLPITYSIQNTGEIPEEFAAEVRNAFSVWEKQGVVLFAETDNKNADIIVEFQQPRLQDVEYGRKYVIAYTMPVINGDCLEKMVIKFYTQNPDGSKFTPNQIFNTALHEIFHALGFMGHSFDKNNIMYLAKDNEILLEDIRLELTEGDVTTLALLYKIKPDITNQGELKGEYLPYLVLGDDEEVNYSKTREAKNYIRQAPMLPGGYIDLAESFVAQKKYPDAIRNLEKALYLAETDDIKYIIFYNLAVSYFYINHSEMALDYAQKAVEIQNSEEVHFLMAEIYLKSGDKKKAEDEYKYLTKISPQNINYAIYLANIYIKKYDYAGARRVLKNFIKNNPHQRNNKLLSPYRILLF